MTRIFKVVDEIGVCHVAVIKREASTQLLELIVAHVHSEVCHHL